MTIATRHAEVDDRFSQYFDIRCIPVPNLTKNDPQLNPSTALAFEFDYPDRPGLSVLRRTKRCYPHIPILMLTIQHSEQLAVWAYRNRVLDYLVAPVAEGDLIRCRNLLQDIQAADGEQRDRTIIDYRSKIPVEIPVGQRVRRVRLAPAVSFVHMNFRRKIWIAEAAEACDMSSFHFSHEFAETFSLTFQ